MRMMKNPFHLLKISTQAKIDDIVKRGKELSICASSDDEKKQIRWAMTELSNPEMRLFYQIHEVPDARYEDGDEWERFIRLYRPDMDNPLFQAFSEYKDPDSIIQWLAKTGRLKGNSQKKGVFSKFMQGVTMKDKLFMNEEG